MAEIRARNQNVNLTPNHSKVNNCFDLRVCEGHATYWWKALDKGYNFSLNLTSIKGFRYSHPKW
jgi:hypothetical protein